MNSVLKYIFALSFVSLFIFPSLGCNPRLKWGPNRHYLTESDQRYTCFDHSRRGQYDDLQLTHGPCAIFANCEHSNCICPRECPCWARHRPEHDPFDDDDDYWDPWPDNNDNEECENR